MTDQRIFVSIRLLRCRCCCCSGTELWNRGFLSMRVCNVATAALGLSSPTGTSYFATRGLRVLRKVVALYKASLKV